MKKYQNVFLLLASALMLNFSCYHKENGIKVCNKLKRNIMCQLLFTYPDLAIPKDTKDVLFANPISEVDTGNTNSIKELELQHGALLTKQARKLSPANTKMSVRLIMVLPMPTLTDINLKLIKPVR